MLDEPTSARVGFCAALLIGWIGVPSRGTTDDWVDLPPLPEPRQEVGVAELDGEIYVIGGIAENRAAVGAVERFSVRTNEWEVIAPLPDDVRLHHVGAASAAGRVYAIGGLNSTFRGVDTVFAFSPESGEWEPVASLNRARGAMGVATAGGKIYAAGGQSGALSFADLEVYDPAVDAWEVLTEMPTARNHLAAVAIGGIIYAAGGRAGALSGGALESFNPTTGEWTELAPLPTKRAGIAAAAFAGKMFVFGGEGNPENARGIFSEVEVYDPAKDEWEERAPMPNPRHGIGAAVVGIRIHIPGGAPSQGFSTTDAHDALVPAEAADRRVPALTPGALTLLVIIVVGCGIRLVAGRRPAG